jgi:hypothetical protein
MCGTARARHPTLFSAASMSWLDAPARPEGPWRRSGRERRCCGRPGGPPPPDPPRLDPQRHTRVPEGVRHLGEGRRRVRHRQDRGAGRVPRIAVRDRIPDEPTGAELVGCVAGVPEDTWIDTCEYEGCQGLIGASGLTFPPHDRAFHVTVYEPRPPTSWPEPPSSRRGPPAPRPSCSAAIGYDDFEDGTGPDELRTPVPVFLVSDCLADVGNSPARRQHISFGASFGEPGCGWRRRSPRRTAVVAGGPMTDFSAHLPAELERTRLLWRARRDPGPALGVGGPPVPGTLAVGVRGAIRGVRQGPGW